VKVCAIQGCTDGAQAKGLCWMHYGRQRRNGDPLASGQHGGRRDEQVRPGVPPDPAPLVALRLELQRTRADDRPFAVAWREALATVPAGDWTAVLNKHRAVWRAAYYRAGPAFALSALEEAWRPGGRSGAPVVLTGQRHDAGRGTLEPVEVPWCN
jgi:hypothetical protein